MTTEISGVLPVFQTPFHTDESIDFATLDREIDWLFENRANGIVMAMVSETFRLATDERRKLAAHICKTVGDRGVTIISVGSESTHTSAALARDAEAVGADAVMAIPPVATAATEYELAEYFRQILKATSIPLIIQDASGYVGKPMTISLQAQMLDDFPDRVLFKPEAEPVIGRLRELLRETNGQARVFEGSGGMHLLESFKQGVSGTMPGADLTPVVSALWSALEAGDTGRADRISQTLIKLVELQTNLDAYLAVEKHLLCRQGVFRNTVIRGPVAFELEDDLRTKVDVLFDELCMVLNDD
ncbi:MAG: dihydrodipicolinate synthase family protein [Planctomycetaceae bacterium]|jgi:4-hydroxy-tetrahydrodipicolinate synthase|nr:dihydrodipicolinate synthase family protein [Planctomycetaceae bacterium]